MKEVMFLSLLFYDSLGEEIEEVQFWPDDELYSSVYCALSLYVNEEILVEELLTLVDNDIKDAIETVLDDAGYDTGYLGSEAERVSISAIVGETTVE